mgnify:CR=1 FL=1
MRRAHVHAASEHPFHLPANPRIAQGLLLLNRGANFGKMPDSSRLGDKCTIVEISVFGPGD